MIYIYIYIHSCCYEAGISGMGPISGAPALPERWGDPCFKHRCRQQVHDRDSWQVHGLRGRGLYQDPVFWRPRVALGDQTGHVWHGNWPRYASAVPFLVDECWMKLVHMFLQYFSLVYVLFHHLSSSIIIFSSIIFYHHLYFHIISSFPDFTEVRAIEIYTFTVYINKYIYIYTICYN